MGTPARGFAFFETAIGVCAIVWSDGGIVGAQLPMAGRAAAARRLAARFPGAVAAEPPPAVGRVIEAVIALLAGEAADVSNAVLDFTGLPAFETAVYQALRGVPAGQTVTYGALARQVGRPGAARAVGKAMGDNPWPILVPCHRVVGADGKAGGFSAPGGVETKARILTIERARLTAEPLLFGDLAVTVRPRARRT